MRERFVQQLQEPGVLALCRRERGRERGRERERERERERGREREWEREWERVRTHVSNPIAPEMATISPSGE